MAFRQRVWLGSMLLLGAGLASLPACGTAGGGGWSSTSGGAPTVDAPTNAGSDDSADTGAGGAVDSTVTLTINVTGQGTTQPAPGTADYPTGTRVTVDAIAADGWRFARWRGDINSAQASVAVLVGDDRSITAEFEPIGEGTVPRFYLPWAPGWTLTTGQANNGSFSHQDRYAWDFTIPIGTPVLAAGAGRVVYVKQNIPNHPEGVTGDPDDPSNVIMIDHGDGLMSLYAHLDQNGAAVVPGQPVARGQWIGYSGDSGYSTGPHLHYEVVDVAGQSTSTGFHEVLTNKGIAEEGDVVTSQNELDLAGVETYVESSLPVDVFAENDVELFAPTPPAFFYTSRTDYTVSGRLLGGMTQACLALVDLDSGETELCELADTEDDGSFAIDFSFPDSLTGSYRMGIVTGTDSLSGVAPVQVLIESPVEANEPPVAIADQPDDDAIDFGDTGRLDGSGSYDPEGQPLSYHWAQVSGPPATIGDVSALSTTFSLGVGEGIVRAAFQLIVFDGRDYSLPARVEYRMLDNFHVLELGVTDRECDSREFCRAVTGSALSASNEVVLFWVDLLNVVEGDAISYEIHDPTGELVLQGDGSVAEQLVARSFRWINWAGPALQAAPGTWRAVFYRNGIEEAETTFSVGP